MDISNISRESLVKKIEDMTSIVKTVNDSAMKHMKNILNNFIKTNGFENICELKEYRGVERYMIGVMDDNGFSNDIDINFEKDWHRENRNKRMLTLGYCSFMGSLYVSQMKKRDYVIILGKLTEKMDELEKQMLDFNWSSYDDVMDKFHHAEKELECYDNAVENRELEEKKSNIMQCLKVGCEIIVGDKYLHGQYDENGHTPKTPDIRRIERVGKKTVDISGIYGRVKMYNIVNKILNKEWKIAEGL